MWGQISKMINDRWKAANKGLLLGVAILLAGLLILSIHRNTEFLGDDDVVCVVRFLSWYKIVLIKSFESLMTTMSELLFFTTRHGNVMPLYYLPFYALFVLFHVPFYVETFQFPIMLFGVISAVLLFVILKKGRVSNFFAFFAALTLIVSPLFAGGSRGLAVHFLIADTFFTAVTILALMNLKDTLGSKIIASWALCQHILGASLFIVAVPVIVFSYIVSRTYEIRKASGLSLWQSLKQAFSLIGHPVILVPGLLCFALSILTYVYALIKAPGLIGNTRLGGIFSKHVDMGIASVNWGTVWANLLVIAGDIFPFLFICSLVLFFKNLRKYLSSFLALSLALLTISYFFIFYLAAKEAGGGYVIYQAFIALPLIGFIFFVLDQELAKAVGWLGGLIVKGVAVIAFLFTINAHVAVVYRKPVFLHSDYYKTSLCYGLNYEKTGIKAIGFILREVSSQTPKNIIAQANRMDAALGAFVGVWNLRQNKVLLSQSSVFKDVEFKGLFTTRALLDVISHDDVNIPSTWKELESLNLILMDKILYQKFPSLDLPQEAKDLLGRAASLEGDQLIRLNRIILETAYPKQCPKSQGFFNFEAKEQTDAYQLVVFPEGAEPMDAARFHKIEIVKGDKTLATMLIYPSLLTQELTFLRKDRLPVDELDAAFDKKYHKLQDYFWK